MIRQLKAGETVPSGPPRRYKTDHGYVRLRWTIGPGREVEVYEHRVIGGRVTEADEVHHRNRVRDDNRPTNLQYLTVAEHHDVHTSPHAAEAVRLYMAGLSTTAVGRRLGVSHQAVNKWLQKANVPRRDPADYAQPLDPQKVASLYQQGMRPAGIATVLRVGRRRVDRTLDILGLPRYRPGRPT